MQTTIDPKLADIAEESVFHPESRFSDSMYSNAKNSFEMVVVFSKHYSRQIFNTFTTNSYNHNPAM
jgi:D-tyrosyl-tRNA(Tyr) deacylase